MDETDRDGQFGAVILDQRADQRVDLAPWPDHRRNCDHSRDLFLAGWGAAWDGERVLAQFAGGLFIAPGDYGLYRRAEFLGRLADCLIYRACPHLAAPFVDYPVLGRSTGEPFDHAFAGAGLGS